MKKVLLFVALALCLVGCGAEEEPVFETIGEVSYEAESLPPAGQIQVALPGDASVQTMAGEDGSEVYTWENHEVRIETRTSGDIEATIAALTGLDADSLTVMKQEKNGMDLYQTVWSTAGEDGTLLGRAMIADDGDYHYCVCLLSAEEVNSDAVYAQLCGSFAVTSADTGK